MKAKTIGLAVLAVVLCLLLGGALLADRLGEKAEQADGQEQSIPLASFSASEITEFGYTWQGQELHFVKVATQEQTQDTASGISEAETQDTWQLADEPEYQIDQTAVSTMLTALSTLSAQRYLESESPEFGLEQPVMTLWANAGGSSCEWEIGAENTVTGSVYLRPQTESGVYLVASNSIASLQKTRDELAVQVEAEITEDPELFGSQAVQPQSEAETQLPAEETP